MALKRQYAIRLVYLSNIIIAVSQVVLSCKIFNILVRSVTKQKKLVVKFCKIFSGPSRPQRDSVSHCVSQSYCRIWFDTSAWWAECLHSLKSLNSILHRRSLNYSFNRNYAWKYSPPSEPDQTWPALDHLIIQCGWSSLRCRAQPNISTNLHCRSAPWYSWLWDSGWSTPAHF